MADAKTAVAHKPIWTDLSTSDAAAAREFYANVFGWDIEVNPDPQYGGYGMAKQEGRDVAGIGPKMSAEAPSAWMVYIGTSSIDDTYLKATSSGGKAVMEPMQVGPQGRMGVIQDPSGATLGLWEPSQMRGAMVTDAPGSLGWVELNARGVDNAVTFYKNVFGWQDKASNVGEGNPPYTEFVMDGESHGGGMEMMPMVPAEVPSYWLAYFLTDDVDKSFDKVIAAGGTELVAPSDFPGGRFAQVTDPQGAAFGLLKIAQQQS